MQAIARGIGDYFATMRGIGSHNSYYQVIRDVKAKIASGEQPVFDSVDALFDKLEAE